MNKIDCENKLDSSLDMKKLEASVLDRWQKDKAFEKSLQGNSDYVFYDGPPFANGLPHYGHLLTGFIKDVFARYHTMLGKRVQRRFGWDCHGLPAEMGAEKSLGISGRKSIEKFGIDKFNDVCARSVMEFSSDWEKYIVRQARWVDFENSYKTMDISFMESVIWAFKTLYDKGLIYESARVLPYSWKCETPVSNFETRIDNSYKPKKSQSVVVSFELKTPPKSLPDGKCKMLVWTTTPWTLPSNLALVVGPDVEYFALEKNGCFYIASKEYWAKNETAQEEINYIKIDHQELVGIKYEPLFDYFKSHKGSFIILCDTFVTSEDGTGIVHCAPGFGEEDFDLCKKHNISLVCPVDSQGKFTNQVWDLAGIQVFDANEKIIDKLRQINALINVELYTHNYPHCWRTDTPLIYKAVNSWYVNVSKFSPRMVEVNKSINWFPKHIKDGLFGKWIENARDWSISRNRFWGTPIPIWKSDNPQYPRIDVYGSISEIEKDFGVTITDLHRPFIDEITRPNPDDPTGNSIMRRVPDVLDCWFESGSMPYAQMHYPFENKKLFEDNFPADFITEYSAQTRGWFYTLVVLSTALFDSHPFKNCLCHGVILDKDGKKLSKRLNNYPDPLKVFDKYGSESLRFLMLSNSVMSGGELLLDESKIKDVLRLVIKPIWSAFSFFKMYVKIDSIEPNYLQDVVNLNRIDSYILFKARMTSSIVIKYMNDYNTISACKALVELSDALNNWYIRRNRARFWKNEIDKDKQDAYNTLFTVLCDLCVTFAPVLPMVTEAIWHGLGMNESVHLEKIKQFNVTKNALVEEMEIAREICTAALALRNRFNIKIRQPLKSISIYGHKSGIVSEYADMIKEEINVKEVKIFNYASDAALQQIKLDFQKLGVRLPDKVKEIIRLVKLNQYRKTEDGNLLIGDIEDPIVVFQEEFKIILTTKDNKYEAISQNIVVELDTNLTPELVKEGKSRDLIRMIQIKRKEEGFEISQRISIKIKSNDIEYIDAIREHQVHIKSQTLADSLEFEKPDVSSKNSLEIIIN